MSVINFDLLYPNHKFTAFVVSLSSILIPVKIDGYADKITLFSPSVFWQLFFECHNSPKC